MVQQVPLSALVVHADDGSVQVLFIFVTSFTNPVEHALSDMQVVARTQHVAMSAASVHVAPAQSVLLADGLVMYASPVVG